MTAVVSLKNIASILRSRRSVIFTHGTFDLLHVGHIQMLKESKNLGGLLVVGVDHDENVPLYKKRTGVIFKQAHRIELIRSLNVVDVVISLDPIRENESLDYHYMKMYLRIMPQVVTYGARFTYSHKVQERCRLINARSVQLGHYKYQQISTSGYIKEIVDGQPEEKS